VGLDRDDPDDAAVLGRSDRRGGVAATAEDVLAQRFARGEIDEDEFTRRRQVPHRTGPTA
jgi:uncharacterized membrane protein